LPSSDYASNQFLKENPANDFYGPDQKNGTELLRAVSVNFCNLAFIEFAA
jgi:hypothetical protein